MPEGIKKTILIVEDDAFLSTLLSTRFQQAGFNILNAIDGDSAIEVLRGQKPDLIMLDIILPKKSGFEVLEQIQSDPTLQKAPVIITSNLGQQADIERGKSLGVIDYFIKAQTPIEDMVSRVNQILASSPQV